MPPFVAHSPSQIVRGTASVVIGSSGQVTITPTSGQNVTLANGQLIVPASGPGLAFAGATTTGFTVTGGVLQVRTSAGIVAEFQSDALKLTNSQNRIIIGSGNDLLLVRSAAGSVTVGGVGNGQLLGIKQLTELTTIAAAATTDTAIQIPANAIVIAVSVRVTVVIPTATAFDYGVSGATNRYGAAISPAANTTFPGTIDALRYYAAAAAIRITPDATPAANTGRVRVTIHYLDVTAPTS